MPVVALDPDDVWPSAATQTQTRAAPPFSSNGTNKGVPPSKMPSPLIDIDVGLHLDLPTLNALCWDAIKQQNDPPSLFLFGTVIVRAFHKPDGAIWLQAVNSEIMRHELSHMANWVETIHDRKRNPTIKQLAKPPVEVVKDVLVSRRIDMPALSRVVSVPVFGSDGTLQTTPGYISSTGVIYAPLNGYQSLSVPDVITQENVDDAKALIENELLKDFPFAKDDKGRNPDRDNAIALFLLPFVRDMIDGPTPLHLIEASMPGSGKNLLAESLLCAGCAKDFAVTTQPRDDEEWRKKLTSLFIEGKPVIFIDNINRKLDSEALASALTAEQWTDRVLGQSATIQTNVRQCWVATGNNVSISTELARRSVRIRLTPDTDRPEEREGFLHDDQREWLAENRPRLAHAAHVLIKWAIQKGLPKPKNKPVGSFERWSRVIGSVLECAGYNDFLANYRDFQKGSDSDREIRASFCAGWWNWTTKGGKAKATCADLVSIAENIDGFELRGSTPKAQQTSLGRYLSSSADVLVEFLENDPDDPYEIYKFKITKAGTGTGADRGKQIWEIECIDKKLRQKRNDSN